jgi:hypothetical protein
MKQPEPNSSLAKAISRLNYMQQRHFVAGVRVIFGCHSLPFNATIFEWAWGKLSDTELEIVIPYILKTFENFPANT